MFNLRSESFSDIINNVLLKPHFLSFGLCLENHIKCIDEDETKLTDGGKQIKHIVMLSAEYIKRHCERNIIKTCVKHINGTKNCKLIEQFF